MLSIIVVVLYLFVVIFDFIPLVKSRQKKEFWVYSGFLAGSFCILFLYSIDVKISSPSIFITKIVEKIFDF